MILDFHFGNSQEHCMKKLVFASAMALAGISLVSAPALRAQDASQITIQDPAEYNAYQNATTQTDPAQMCSALESFLTSYPQSVVKKAVLTQMIDCYQKSNQPDKVISAASRLLQVDPNNPQAIFTAVYYKKAACTKSLDASGATNDAQTCDDAAALAQKGLALTKPAAMADADWTKFSGVAFPIFHSMIALDDAVSKKDFKAAIDEYTKELNLFPLSACSGPGQCLIDTLQLAQVYAKPSDARDEVKAIWFYARAWDYAPAAFKPQIETPLEFWYKKYHGMLDGEAAVKSQIDAVKTQAQATLFPPEGFKIDPAPSNQDLANKYCAVSPDDLKKLALEDKEFILANGSKDCTDKLWGVMKDQVTPVPGIVIADPANALNVSVTTAASVKPKDYVVKLTTPGPCSAVPPPPTELKVKDAQAYLQANGVSADVSAVTGLETAKKISIEPAVASISVAVTQDAKDTNKADFNVNLKTPLSCKDAPAEKSELKLQPALELDGTYDTYTLVPAAGTTAASAQIVLRDGFVQAEKKAGPVHHVPAKPPAAHHAQ
jgi:hypothetical protein